MRSSGKAIGFWKWMEIVAQLADESIAYVVSGPTGRSGGLIGTLLKKHSLEQEVYFPNYYILFGPCRVLQSRRHEEPEVDWGDVVQHHADWGVDVHDLSALELILGLDVFRV